MIKLIRERRHLIENGKIKKRGVKGRAGKGRIWQKENGKERN